MSALPALVAVGKGKRSRYYAVAFYDAHLALPTLNSFMAAILGKNCASDAKTERNMKRLNSGSSPKPAWPTA